MEHFQSVGSHSLYILVDVFQIIPPKQWTPMSKQVPDDFVLEHVYMQTRSKLPHGGWEIEDTKMESMTYRDYVQSAKANESEFFDEDSFWNDTPSRKNMYSINNNLSLFGDNVQLWNLSKLTKTHSNIHGTKPENVSDNPAPVFLQMQIILTDSFDVFHIANDFAKVFFQSIISSPSIEFFVAFVK